MKKFIQLSRTPYEEPYHVNLLFKASNGENTGQLEIYDNAQSLVQVAEFFEDFPFQDKKHFEWKLGSEHLDDNFAFFFYCSFSLAKRSSKCHIHIRLNNNKTGPEKAITEFTIICDPIEAQQLGKLFKEFSKLEKESLIWTGIEGHLS